jgi:hypothetical protein
MARAAVAGAGTTAARHHRHRTSMRVVRARTRRLCGLHAAGATVRGGRAYRAARACATPCAAERIAAGRGFASPAADDRVNANGADMNDESPESAALRARLAVREALLATSKDPTVRHALAAELIAELAAAAAATLSDKGSCSRGSSPASSCC